MLTRDEAIILLKKYLRDEDNVKYSLAVEAIMKEIARILNMDEELWGLTGLLHNLDYEYTAREPEKRGSLTEQLLDGLIPEDGINAIKANNYMHTDYIPTTTLDKILIASDAISGIILVTGRSMSSKKLTDVDLEMLIEKFNDTSFATRYNRSRVGLCNDVGIDLKHFLNLSLNCLQNISDQLGL